MELEINVISETAQEFKGERFYLCGHYFQHNGKRLHRAVWEAHNGEIPKGYHVHHIDGDRAHNEIINLALISATEHISMHMSTEERKEKSREDVRKAIAAAAAWHGSEAGYDFHSRLAKQIWASVKPRQKVCTWCGRIYETRDLSNRTNHFCSANCRAAYGRRKRRNESQVR